MPNPKLTADANWYTSEAGGYGKDTVIKALTFANNAAPIDLFTVTGDVIVRVVAICKTNVASAAAANISVGISGAGAAAIIASTVATAILQNEIWHDNSPDATIEAASVAGMAGFIISNGADIILTPSAQVDSGAITFYCIWTPLSTNGSVTAA